MTFKKHLIDNQSGFTLVEAMIALVITVVFLGSILATYTTQHKSQSVQKQVAEMQQNIRSAMLHMTRDIRQAGCDPRQISGAGITVATRGQIGFTMDIAGHAVNPNDGDGATDDANENIIFGLDPAVDTDLPPDGIPDAAATADFCRNDVNGANIFQPIAENIEMVEFNYLDEDGVAIAAPITSQADRNRIRAVQISLLVRSSRQDSKLLNTATYTTAGGTVWDPPDDGFRRRIEMTTIQCRNMGL